MKSPQHCARNVVGTLYGPDAVVADVGVIVVFIMPPPHRGGGALGGHRRPSSVCSSDVAYIGFNSKTKRPRKTKLCTGLPQVTCDSHTDFKVKSQCHGAMAYCGGHLAAQLVIIIIVIINIISFFIVIILCMFALSKVLCVNKT